MAALFGTSIITKARRQIAYYSLNIELILYLYHIHLDILLKNLDQHPCVRPIQNT